MGRLLVGLPDVNVLAVADLGIGQVVVNVETVLTGASACSSRRLTLNRGSRT